MTTKECPPLWGFGTTKTYKIPIEHLDFKYIEKCSDVKHLEKILCVLRSGEEGYYPELTEFCEKRLQGLAPESRALRKDKPAATAASFTAEEWDQIDRDMKSWVSEIKKEEDRMHFHETEQSAPMEGNLPPVRGSSSCLQVGKEKSSKSKPTKKKIPRDYAEWDKFDVEKECAKVDDNYKEQTVVDNKLHLSQIETRIDTTGLTEKEKCLLAAREKEKGNEAFNSGDFEEAVMYYTRSISALPTVAAYNNRAQAGIKLQNWTSAFQDCERVLELEPGNVKALLRRATTYKHQNKLQEAIDDLRKVLEVEPDNDLAKKTLSEVERDLKNSAPALKPQTKGKRMVIQEVEHSDEEGGKDSAGRREAGSADAAASQLHAMGNIQKKLTGRSDGGSKRSRQNRAPSAANRQGSPPRTPARARAAGAHEHPTTADLRGVHTFPKPADLKNQGNELFKNGQFGQAAAKYSAAIKQLNPTESTNADDLSILYSNRAACFLKEGNCSNCIQDCNRALEHRPFSLKPLLRRAMAYEMLEQYRPAYVDYKTALQIDCTIQLANDSVNRITRILMQLDGPTWREKLSPIPVVPVSLTVPGWCSAAKMTPDQKGDLSSLHRPGVTDEKFKALKEEGNQCVKNKNYTDALSKYSECLKINNQECTIYTNRALCYLKLCQFEEAKQECDQALRMDGSNVKAHYRRALAHKGLQNYQKSLTDLNKVLQLNPNIVEAKMELEEVTRFLNPKENAASFNKEKERKKIEIQEVDERSDKEPPGTVEDVCADGLAAEPGKESRGALEDAATLQVSRPTNAYEFGQVMNAISMKKDQEACAGLLALTAPQDLPMLLSNKLEGDTFLLLIQALKNHLLDKDPSLVYQHLLYLSQANRFKMMLTLISQGQKEQIQALFVVLADTPPNSHFTLEDVQALKRQYEL
ncbi:sperm-associated antigen 1 [Ochotona princeps]|uniref:sperm-associated antigen 1 n=1 Tax=Ochotona princeps TaxID=9978 RepID=UPI0027154E10|nr:sperm-associated antigen 1 [Ochotona princeps]XP_058524567.1 sperm-associated antigen 1 [Ochotona princeps]